MIAFIPMARPTGRYFGSKSKRRTNDDRSWKNGGQHGAATQPYGSHLRSVQQVTTSGDPDLSRFAGHVSDSGKDAGPLRLRSMKQYRPQFSRRRFMSDSVLGARRTLPTSSCPRCGTNSVDIWRSPTANPKSLEGTSKKVLGPGIGPDKRATNYAATSLVGKDKHELADLSTNHRSVSSRFGFAIVLYGTKVDRRHGEGHSTRCGRYREPRP